MAAATATFHAPLVFICVDGTLLSPASITLRFLVVFLLSRFLLPTDSLKIKKNIYFIYFYFFISSPIVGILRQMVGLSGVLDSSTRWQ